MAGGLVKGDISTTLEDDKLVQSTRTEEIKDLGAKILAILEKAM